MKKLKKAPKKIVKKVKSKTVKRIKKILKPEVKELITLKEGDMVYDNVLDKTFQANQSIEHKVSTDPNRYELA